MALLPYLILRFKGLLAKDPLILFLPLILYFLMSSCGIFFQIHFFPPVGIGFLKRPLIISLARLMQFSLIFFSFNYIWLLLKERRAARWVIFRYIDISYWIAIATIFSYLIGRVTGSLTPFVYDSANYLVSSGRPIGLLRARGLFNEGGPYGLSLITSISLAIMMRFYGEKMAWYKILILSAALILSLSKASLVCAFMLLGIYSIRSMSLKKILLVSTISVGILFGFLYINRSFLGGFLGYYNTLEKIADESYLINPNNGSVAYGRVAATFIAPKIFIDRPFLGVGLGNYSLVRNNPKYRGSFPKVGWDLPGLGIIDLVLEGGLIGLAVLLGSYYCFYRSVSKKHNQMKFLFFVPLLQQICGVQFHFAYPWFFFLMIAKFLSNDIDYHGGEDIIDPRAPRSSSG